MSKAWPPNILLIIGDDVGKDITSITGTGAARTLNVSNGGIVNPLPNLSLLLRNGLNFNQTWAEPACSPTRAAIYTGTQPWRNGVGNPGGLSKLDAHNMALPRVLPQGYHSGLFGKWHLGSSSPNLPTEHGWDKHVGTLEGVVGSYFSWGKCNSDDWDYPYDQSGQAPPTRTEYLTTDTVKEAATWIRRLDPDAPWFATIAFHTPHDPLHAPPEGHNLGTPTTPQAQFNAMVQNLDYNVGRLLGSVQALPIPKAQLENTIIIFVGDNGSDDPIAVFEEKTEIYEGGIRVPLIIADGRAVVQEMEGATVAPIYLDPDKLNTSTAHMVHVVDLFRTITTLAGVPDPALPTAARVDSRSLVDLCCLAGPQKEARVFNFAQYYENGAARQKLATVRDHAYKLNCQLNSTVTPPPPTFQLFKYIGGEIPGAEDVATAPDIYPQAAADPTSPEGKALSALKLELHRHKADGVGTEFPW